jgi:parallel beta helix pectate lyase-like protein
MIPVERRGRRRRARLPVLAATVLLALIASAPCRAAAREIGPDANLCAEIHALPQGEELVLAPGDYRGPCAIRRGGEVGAPLVIRAADPKRRPRIVYLGRDTNVFEVRASHVIIRGLEFGPVQADVDAVRIFAANDVTVEECRFTQLGGIAVVANHANVRGLVVRRNVIQDSQATAMYFGCHDGAGCSITELVVEGNFIQGVTAPDPEIGYGMQVKLNSAGILRDNIVMNTKGPGIMVYGSGNLPRVSLVERNIVIGSRTSSGIVVGGGPAIVRNNVTVSNEQAGISLEDYKKRGLLRAIAVANNTVYGNRAGGITAPEAGISGITIVNNAVHTNSGTQAYPPETGLRPAGNVDCTANPCFANPERQDFSPSPGSLLKGAGVSWPDMWMPREDLFGVRRGVPPTAGAIERPSRPLSLAPQP